MFEIAIITGICLVSVLVSYAAFRRGASRSADDPAQPDISQSCLTIGFQSLGV